MYDVFLICPVRNANSIQKEKINKYIADLENKGFEIYYPARDTNQNDKVGFRICMANKQALENSKEVHIFWDKNSQGSLFDLGMAFYAVKDIVIANPEDVEITEDKSFANVITYLNGFK